MKKGVIKEGGNMKEKRYKIFSPNESTEDRILRAIVGLVFLYLGYTYSPWLYIIAAIGLITAADGFCLIYWIFNLGTKKPKR